MLARQSQMARRFTITLGGKMNYCIDGHDYMEIKSQFERERMTEPCDIAEGVYALVDDDSPSESPIYFRSIDGAVSWAEGSYPYCNGNWSVYKVGAKVL